MSRALVPLVALIVLASSPSLGTTWRVAADGSGDFETVSAACAAASAGDSVLISPGSYDEYDGPGYGILIREKPITLLGNGARPEDTNLRMSFFFAESGGSVVENVRIHDEMGSIINQYGSLTIRRCVFEGNVGPDDEAVWVGAAVRTSADLLIEDSVFIENRLSNPTSSAGGAVAELGYSLVLRRCVFIGNEVTGEEGGAVYAPDHPVIQDCVFWKNKAGRGAAVTAGGWEMEISGCTFVENEVTGPFGAALEIDGYADPGVQRCVFANTRRGYGIGCWGAQELYCCDFWGNESGDYDGWVSAPPEHGNIFEDPLFCNAALGDFRLMENSPCLPGNHGGWECGLIGALGVGCTVATEVTSWGKLKSLFR